MKKFLSVLLAVVMLLPCVIVPTAAAAAVSHAVTITNCDYSVPGWGGILKAGTAIEGSEDEGVISHVFPAGEEQGAIAALMLSFTSDTEIDISAYTKACVRAYVTNVEVMGPVQINTELTSGGTCDVEENQSQISLNDLAGGELVEGWNTLTWSIGGGGLKPAEWDFMRCFNNQYAFTPTEDATFAVDSFWFEDDAGNKLPISDCKMELTGWEGKAVAVPDTEDFDAFGNAYMKSELANEKLDLTLTIVKEKSFVDTSKCATKFITFEFFCADPSALKGDITFEVISGDNKMTFKHDLLSIVDEGVKEGWNTATIALTDKQGDDFSKVNQFKVYTSEALNTTVGLDYVRVVDGIITEGDEQMHENYSENMDQFLADGVYHFPIIHANNADSVVLMAKTAGKLNLQVSMDGTNWTDVVKTDLDLAESYRLYNLTEIADFAKSGDLYIKAASGSIKSEDMILDVIFNVPSETSSNPHYELVSPCDTKTGWATAAEPDTDIKSQGKASLALTLSGAVKNANVMFQFKAADTRVTSYDVTDRFAEGGIVFDLYTASEADAALLGAMRINIEVTSSGGCDQEEIATETDINSLVDGGLKEGWNLVVVPFAKLTGKTGEFNTANFNYIRIFTQGNAADIDCGEGVTFNVDNLRIWDGNDGSEIESHKFTVFADSEKAYLQESSNAPTNDSCRFSDGNTFSVYKFEIENIINVVNVSFTATVGQQLKLEVSTDGYDWKVVHEEPKPDTESGGLAIKEYTFDLTEFVNIDVPDFENIYLRISDSVPENGWGGAIYNTTEAHLDVKYINAITDEDRDAVENHPTKHSVPLPVTNVAWASGLEKDIVFSGSSSIKIIPNKGVCAPNIAFKDNAVDATGMDTLEFEIYFGNDEAIARIRENNEQGQIEVCSGGVCDNQECTSSWDDLFNSIEGDIEPGKWMHVSIPLEDKAGWNTLELDHVNYFRAYFINNTDIGDPDAEDFFFLLDNIRLTDAKAQEKAKFKPEAEAVAVIVRELVSVWESNNKEVTKDNVDAVRAAYDKANDAVSKMSAEAKGVLGDIDSSLTSTLSKVKRAIQAYDKAAEAGEETQPQGGEETQPQGGEETQAQGGEETKPTENPDGKSNTGLIIGIVAGVVVIAGAAVGIILGKKKKK